MSRDTLTLDMYLHDERPAAVRVASHANPIAARTWWLPRSLIGYSRRDPATGPGLLRPYTFTLPEWKVEAAGLWDFVTS